MLRDAAGQGRITFDELDERLGVAYAAKTYADLEAVTSDLPAQPAFAQPARPARSRRIASAEVRARGSRSRS